MTHCHLCNPILKGGNTTFENQQKSKKKNENQQKKSKANPTERKVTKEPTKNANPLVFKEAFNFCSNLSEINFHHIVAFQLLPSFPLLTCFRPTRPTVRKGISVHDLKATPIRCVTHKLEGRLTSGTGDAPKSKVCFIQTSGSHLTRLSAGRPQQALPLLPVEPDQGALYLLHHGQQQQGDLGGKCSHAGQQRALPAPTQASSRPGSQQRPQLRSSSSRNSSPEQQPINHTYSNSTSAPMPLQCI